MTIPLPYPDRSGHAGPERTDADLHGFLRPSPEDEVSVVTRRWCTATMIPAAVFMCLTQVSFAAQPYIHDASDARYLWMILATLLAFPLPFVLVARRSHPEPVFWACCAIVLIFPYDPLLMLMALTSLLARRSSRIRSLRAIAAAAAVSVWCQLRDALRPAESSLWHAVFARPKNGDDTAPTVMLAGDATIIVTAIVVSLIATLIAVLVGLHIRSRARLHEADARTQAAQHQAASLQSDLDNQRLSDAIAAETHDTLAHSLSLIALNASALQAEAGKLAADTVSGGPAAHPSPASDIHRQAATIARRAEDIRRQAAGALDEAHALIDMLRHPQQAWEQLSPDADTALTRESMDALIGDAREAGMTLNTWIDIRQLTDLDDRIGKIAYRAVQEGLTNARRHAAGAPVSLEVTANPETGIHVHVSNPTAPDPDGPRPDPDGHRGTGLSSLTARVRSAGGTCRHGLADRLVFHVDAALPWVPAPGADRDRPEAGGVPVR